MMVIPPISRILALFLREYEAEVERTTDGRSDRGLFAAERLGLNLGALVW
jgi:hypothetical protein